tara:strand:+ start:12598 stop:13056 length:459 start_codon:yes stop_codon:yes gene_type:complete
MKTPASSEKNEGLLVLYSVSVSEIAQFKSQQWHTINYALLLFAAVIAIASNVSEMECPEVLGLYLLTTAVLLASLYVIRTLFGSIEVRRKRLTHIRTRMSPDFMDCWRYGESEEEVLDNPDEKIKLSWLFYSVLILAAIATFWLLTKLTWYV